jgi:hypothetical protein
MLLLISATNRDVSVTSELLQVGRTKTGRHKVDVLRSSHCASQFRRKAFTERCRNGIVVALMTLYEVQRLCSVKWWVQDEVMSLEGHWEDRSWSRQMHLYQCLRMRTGNDGIVDHDSRSTTEFRFLDSCTEFRNDIYTEMFVLLGILSSCSSSSSSSSSSMALRSFEFDLSLPRHSSRHEKCLLWKPFLSACLCLWHNFSD